MDKKTLENAVKVYGHENIDEICYMIENFDIKNENFTGKIVIHDRDSMEELMQNALDAENYYDLRELTDIMIKSDGENYYLIRYDLDEDIKDGRPICFYEDLTDYIEEDDLVDFLFFLR